jgi:hypothetical protein
VAIVLKGRDGPASGLAQAKWSKHDSGESACELPLDTSAVLAEAMSDDCSLVLIILGEYISMLEVERRYI